MYVCLENENRYDILFMNNNIALGLSSHNKIVADKPFLSLF